MATFLPFSTGTGNFLVSDYDPGQKLYKILPLKMFLCNLCVIFTLGIAAERCCNLTKIIAEHYQLISSIVLISVTMVQKKAGNWREGENLLQKDQVQWGRCYAMSLPCFPWPCSNDLLLSLAGFPCSSLVLQQLVHANWGKNKMGVLHASVRSDTFLLILCVFAAKFALMCAFLCIFSSPKRPSTKPTCV